MHWWRRSTDYRINLYLLGKELQNEVALEVRYKDKKIRDLCEKKGLAEKKLGAASARKLKVRLVALEAAARVTDLVAGNPHPLKATVCTQFKLLVFFSLSLRERAGVRAQGRFIVN
jgi:plasmid maintenance system killer protein